MILMERRRWRKPIVILLFLGIGIVVAVSWWRSSIESEGRKKLDAIVTQINANDPRWRAEDLLADQQEIPAHQNSALMVAEFWQTVGEYRRFWISPFGIDPNLGGNPDPREQNPSRLLKESEYSLIQAELQGTDATWPVIERISRSRRGRIQRTTDNSLWNSNYVLEQRPDAVSRFIDWRCEELARDRQAKRVETALLALLNLARLEGYTVSHDGQGQQYYELANLCRRIERLLALDSIDDRAGRLQTELAEEAEADRLRRNLRILRADWDRFFQACDSGEDSLAAHLGERGTRTPTLETRVKAWVYRPHRFEDRAEAIGHFTSALALVDLPDHQQLIALASLPSPPVDDQHPFSRNCPAYTQQTFEKALRTKAFLRSTVAALAAERYRLLTGDWPPSFESIPKAILPTVPIDPFTGKPLLIARRPDGITIYSVGIDGFDDGGAVGPLYPIGKPGGDIGIRLYDADKRRLPPL